MSVFSSDRVSRRGVISGILAFAAAGTAQTAHAGPLRFLFGGNGDQRYRDRQYRRRRYRDEQQYEDRQYRDQPYQDRRHRDWSDVTSRRHVAFNSEYEPGTIVVSFADRRLYYVVSRGEALSYLIGIPVLEEKWSGESWVSEKRVDPRWIPTADMRAKDPSLPLEVPGGHPRNPLGPRALYLGETLYRIHGTDAPWTVGQVVSNGCIRLYNRDIIDLYNRVPKGTKVVVTWQPMHASAAPQGTGVHSSYELQRRY